MKKLLALGVVALALLGSGYALGQRFATAPREQSVAVPLTASVERRVLTDSILLSGDVLPTGEPFAIADRTSGGPPVVTAAPVTAGSPVIPGVVVVEVSGRPVFLFSGDVPVYRPLEAGTVGRDVQQLEDGLVALGLLAGTPDTAFDAETATAVERLYREAGYEPPTGEVVPTAEIAFAPGQRWVVLSSDLQVGQSPTSPLLVVGPGSPALHASTDQQRAVRIREGMKARVVTASGERDGTVSSIQRVAGEAESDGLPPRVVITTDPELPAEEVGGSGRAEVHLDATEEPVLVVPVTALRRNTSDEDAVVVVHEDGARDWVRVDVVVVAGGAAAVESADPMLHEGAQVLIHE